MMRLHAASTLGLLPAFAVLMLGGCSDVESETPEAAVLVRTNPPGAECELIGANDYRADVETPARLKIRIDVSPLKVTCFLDGYRPAHGTLAISPKGWWSPIAEIGADSLAVIGFDGGSGNPKQEPVTTFDANLKPSVQSYIKQQ